MNRTTVAAIALVTALAGGAIGFAVVGGGGIATVEHRERLTGTNAVAKLHEQSHDHSGRARRYLGARRCQRHNSARREHPCI